MGEASAAHYAAERAEHLRNADEELGGRVGEDIGMLDGVPQRCPGSVTGYYTQAEVDRIAGKERKPEVDPDRFLRELDEKRVEVGKRLLLPVLNKEGGKEVENVEGVRITVDGVEFIPDGLSSSEALADKPPNLRDYKILSVDTEYVKPTLAQVADKLLPPVLNKTDSDLVDAVFNARIEALAALRRFTSAEASSVMRHAWELSALLAADARLEESERALKETE